MPTSPVSMERFESASNWKFCFKDQDPNTGQAAVGCEGFSKQFAGMQHVIEDLTVHTNELAVQLQAARDAVSLSRSNEQRSLAMATLAASSTSRKPDHGRIKSFETRFTKEANRFNADGSITVEAFFQELEHDFYAHSVDGSTPDGLAHMREVLISCLGPKVRGEHVRLRKEFETNYPGQPLEYDRIKSTMLVRYHLPETANEMRDAWAALKQKQEETMRDFLIKIDNQVDLLDAKGITLTPGDFVYALKKKCLPGIVQAVQDLDDSENQSENVEWWREHLVKIESKRKKSTALYWQTTKKPINCSGGG
eukprot:SAG11_NODE_402_length_9751_cov_7.372047_4_plen_309_part_00